MSEIVSLIAGLVIAALGAIAWGARKNKRKTDQFDERIAEAVEREEKRELDRLIVVDEDVKEAADADARRTGLADRFDDPDRPDWDGWE